jgi:hypothetical protein
MPYRLPNKSLTLFIYGGALLLLGFASTWYNPLTGQIGLHVSSKSFLADSLIAAFAAIGFGVYALREKFWAHCAGAILAFILLCNNVQMAFKVLKIISTDPLEQHRSFECILLWLRGLLSLGVLMPLLLYIRAHRSTAEDSAP